MNKQEVMKELTDAKRIFRYCWSNDYARDGFEEGIECALETVNKLDEPEKPVIPKFVADYIYSEQHSYSTLSEAIDNMVDEEQILNWFYVNSETFAKAWLFGYSAKKEKNVQSVTKD